MTKPNSFDGEFLFLLQYNSLYALGLAVDHYTLHTGSTVINLMEINASGLQWEHIHDGYLELTRKVTHIDIQESPALLDALAEEIYGYLKTVQKKCEGGDRIFWAKNSGLLLHKKKKSKPSELSSEV